MVNTGIPQPRRAKLSERLDEEAPANTDAMAATIAEFVGPGAANAPRPAQQTEQPPQTTTLSTQAQQLEEKTAHIHQKVKPPAAPEAQPMHPTIAEQVAKLERMTGTKPVTPKPAKIPVEKIPTVDVKWRMSEPLMEKLMMMAMKRRMRVRALVEEIVARHIDQHS